MWRKINQLREQPKEVRSRYAFWYAFVFTAAVTVVWMSSLPARFDSLALGEQEEQVREESSFSRAWKDLKAAVITAPSGKPILEEIGAAPLPEESEMMTADQFIASSTPPKPEGRPILIGTTPETPAESTQ